MLKFKTPIKSLLCAAFIVCLLMTLVSLISVEYRKGASSQLPVSCKDLSLQRTISITCQSEITKMKKAPDIERPICYDNDKYVDCEMFAKDILNSKQSLAVFSVLSFITGGLAIFSLRRWNKQ